MRNHHKQSYLAILLLILISSACNTSRNANINRVKAIEARLDRAYSHWRGTPYRLGGDSKRGVDCSALMQNIMRSEFGVSIPRTTRLQLKDGKRISRRNLSAGDFVFFKTGANTYHVGVMIRPGKFMHASTSKGVIISELKNPYWSKRIIGYRRFL